MVQKRGGGAVGDGGRLDFASFPLVSLISMAASMAVTSYAETG
jgi:hypothetical protein